MVCLVCLVCLGTRHPAAQRAGGASLGAAGVGDLATIECRHSDLYSPAPLAFAVKRHKADFVVVKLGGR